MTQAFKRWSCAIASFFAFSASASAAPPVDLFYKPADIVELTLSPSGQRLALTFAYGQQRVGLVTLDLSKGDPPKRIAQFSEGDVAGVHWVNDDRLVFSVVDVSQGSGRVTTMPGLFAIDANGAGFRALVSRDTPYPAGSMLGWHHEFFRVPKPQANETNEDVLVMGHGDRATLIRLNTRTGQSESVVQRTALGTYGWLTDSSGAARVMLTASGKSRQSAFWRKTEADDWQKLYENDPLDAPFEAHSVDDAGNLYVTRREGPEGYRVLTRYDFSRKAPEKEPLVSTPGFDFAGHLVTERGGPALGVRVAVDTERTVWFNPAMKAFQEQVDQQFPGRINHIVCHRCAQPDMVALVLSYSDHEPGEYLLYRAQPPEGKPNWRTVGRRRQDIKPADMADMDFHRIRARDGRDLPVWVTKRPGTKGPLPAVVLVHGGPWVRGGVWGWDADAQFLATRGYVVIEPEMRGSAGYGEAHLKAGFKQFGQAMQDDVADALRWAQAQGIASDKACIAGASYGGYSALMGLIKDPDLYRCGVAWLAITDLDLYLSGSIWVNDDIGDDARKYTLPDMVGDADKDAAMIRANSPVKQAKRIKAPLLLAFGESDVRVPIAHGKRLKEALEEAGNPPVYLKYAGEGHGFGSVKNQIDFSQRMADFLAKYLQP